MLVKAWVDISFARGFVPFQWFIPLVPSLFAFISPRTRLTRTEGPPRLGGFHSSLCISSQGKLEEEQRLRQEQLGDLERKQREQQARRRIFCFFLLETWAGPCCRKTPEFKPVEMNAGTTTGASSAPFQSKKN